MRFLLFFIGLFLLSPLEAGAAPARKPAAAAGGTPARVITFSCRENADEPVLALGLAYLRTDSRDPTAASVGLSLYVQVKKNIFAAKTYQGSAVAVPGGFTFAVQGNDDFTLNLHPHERTTLPGISGKTVACVADASVSANP